MLPCREAGRHENEEAESSPSLAGVLVDEAFRSGEELGGDEVRLAAVDRRAVGTTRRR